MSNNVETTIEYIYSIEIDKSTNKKTFKLESQAHDTAEQLELARKKMDEDIAADAAATQIPAKTTPSMVRTTHPLVPFIELAMRNVHAANFENPHPVWNEMMRLAQANECLQWICGYVGGHGFKYRGRKFETNTGNRTDYFDKPAFLQMFRRQRTYG